MALTTTQPVFLCTWAAAKLRQANNALFRSPRELVLAQTTSVLFRSQVIMTRIFDYLSGPCTVTGNESKWYRVYLPVETLAHLRVQIQRNGIATFTHPQADALPPGCVLGIIDTCTGDTRPLRITFLHVTRRSSIPGMITLSPVPRGVQHRHSRRPFTTSHLTYTRCAFGVCMYGKAVYCKHNVISPMLRFDLPRLWQRVPDLAKQLTQLGGLRDVLAIAMRPGTCVKIFYANAWITGVFVAYCDKKYIVQCDCDPVGILTKTTNPRHIHFISV